MPYLAWRIPFLSTLNFNANTLRWPPYSSSCFDIILHFPEVCVGLLFLGESERRSVCTTVTLLRSQLADLLCKNVARLNIVWRRCVAGFFGGISRRGKREKGRAGARARGEWEKRREENWGFLWSPLSRSEEQSGDQSGLFYVAGARLWSPRVTYSTHFIKFTSVLIADQ